MWDQTIRLWHLGRRLLAVVTVCLLALWLAGCCSVPPPLPPESVDMGDQGPGGDTVPTDPDTGDTPRAFPRDATKDFYWVRVFYGTNRVDTGVDDPVRRYRRDYTSTISYGVADVSIPGRHRPGQLENPSFSRLEFRPDPERHVVLMKAIPLDHDSYMADLRERIAERDNGECFIFVHGFNMSFEDAARRTAQMAYDMDYQGAPIFYSWPSQYKMSIGGYKADRRFADQSIPQLRQFIEETARRSGARKVNIIAHSMGGHLLTQALQQVAAEMQDDAGLPLINEIILAAPDVNTRNFLETIAPAMNRVSHGVTVYASDHDRALTISNCLNNVPILGNSANGLVVSDRFQMIDASAADTNPLGIGHSYYGYVPAMLRDIGAVLRGIGPRERQLQETAGSRGRHWTLSAHPASPAAPAVSGTDAPVDAAASGHPDVALAF